MKLIRFFFGAVLISCASSTPQVDQLLSSQAASSLPKQKIITDVPFILQDEGHCGPATLTMAMKHLGVEVDLKEIIDQTYSPNAEGSYRTDMISAVRRNGLVGIPITGLERLLKELEAGNPVIVFENLAFDWYPLWHFALVFGYDLNKQVVHLHSGADKHKVWEMTRFEKSWKRGQYWGLVVFRPDQIPTLATANQWARQLASLEKIGKFEEAFVGYELLKKSRPKSPWGYLGLGNIYFRKSQYKLAAHNFEQVTRISSGNWIAWFNLALSYKELKMTKKAKVAANKSINLAPDFQKGQIQQTVKDLL